MTGGEIRGIAEEQAKRGIARIRFLQHQQAMALCTDIIHAENGVVSQAAFERKHIFFSVRNAIGREVVGKAGDGLEDVYKRQGMGAVSTTFMAGVELVRKGKSQPVGSLTQLGTIRLGKRTDGRTPKISEFVPLADLKDIAFGGWDIFTDNAYQSAANAGVLNPQDLAKVKGFLSKIKPMKAAFDHNFVKLIDGPNTVSYTHLRPVVHRERSDHSATRVAVGTRCN